MAITFKSIALLLLPILSIQAADPGLPLSNPTISYWQIPPNPDVADHQSSQLPSYADVVIIGSGMTGTSVAYHLLKNNSQPLRVAMLEARQACSGATGRNGGHIRPSSYDDYANAKASLGQSEAAKITRLRAAHIDALISAAGELDEEGRNAAEARYVDSIDAFFDQQSWDQAKSRLDDLKRNVADIGAEWQSFEQDEARNISLLAEATGIFTGTPNIAGALWPYRFVTHTLKAMLKTYPTFSLDTGTPAVNITSLSESQANFEVATPRGNIQTRHVVHATNAWVPHFVPGLDGRINALRLHMSAQLGGAGLPKAGQWPSYSGNGSLPGGRAWSLYRNGLDYLVQMPRNGEYMYGGGEDLEDDGNVPTTDDSAPPNHFIASYLGGSLASYFGYDKWGPERTDFPQQNDSAVWEGRTKRVWTGVDGYSRDGYPYVGLVSPNLTGRQVRNNSAGAEWVAASYNSDGMCYAWLCGKAVSSGLLGGETGGNRTLPDWFPLSLEVTEERLRRNGTAGLQRARRLSRRWAP